VIGPQTQDTNTLNAVGTQLGTVTGIVTANITAAAG
jgi:hypothetical protein